MALLSQQAIGESPAFHGLMDRVSDAASLQSPVMLIGERGTGKGLMASRLHFLSPRWEQVYVVLNCAGYNEAELEAQLFGRVYYEGLPDVDSVFVKASGGTLCLENIQACPPRLQERLLRSIEQREITVMGEAEPREIDVRLLTSASPSLIGSVHSGAFHADLFGALAFHTLVLPPLRTRTEDIPPLAEYFGRKITATLGAERFPGFTAEAMAALMAQPWPGNVRGLKRAVERSVENAFLEDESLVQPISQLAAPPLAGVEGRLEAPPAEILQPAEMGLEPSLNTAPSSTASPSTGSSLPFPDRVMIFERGLIDEAMQASAQHQGRASEYLGLSYHQFRGLLRKHGLKK